MNKPSHEYCKDCKDWNGNISKCMELCGIPMDIIEEWEKYRELGTVEEIKSLIAESEEEFNMLMEYRGIGTVEELREAMEKQEPKKPRFYAQNYYCSKCGNLVGNKEFGWQRFMYCDHCGNAIDWSEEK